MGSIQKTVLIENTSRQNYQRARTFRRFKTQEDQSKLLKELHSDLIEAMLDDELDAYLGYFARFI